MRILKIGGGPVISKGNGTAVFTVLSQVNPLKYYEVVFKDALYLPDIDVNLFSGLKHYKLGGYFEKNRLCIFQGGIIVRLNIVKMGFFISLKGYKSRSVFANFCFSSYMDDFYIPVSARSLKVGSIRSNVSEGGTPKLGLYRPKDRQWSEVLKGVKTGDNGFRDPSSWESTEGGLRVPEDRPCEPVESQEVTVGPKQASIGGLDLETSRGTARERPCMFAEPRDVEETDDTRKNLKGYNALLQFASF